MGDWADEEAVAMLKMILSPKVTIDEATELLAASFRMFEARGAHRGVIAVDEGLKKVFAS